MEFHVTKAHHSYNHPDLGDTPAIYEVNDSGLRYRSSLGHRKDAR